jgi:hypothetical protein
VSAKAQGECKAFDRFEENDTRRMNRLAVAFPGAALVFGTLRRQLDANEKKMITSLARRGRHRLQDGSWRNPRSQA